MAQIKMETPQVLREGIDLETLELYWAEVAHDGIKVLESHTTLINQMYQNGLADFNDAIHLQHINKRLCKKLRLTQRARSKSLVPLAVELALKERGPLKAP